MRPTTIEGEGRLICDTISGFLATVGLSENGLLSNPEFIEILIHAGARSFGLIIEISMEAIGEAVESDSKALMVDHFADAYFMRTNSDDDMNPFVSKQWRSIDTRKAMDRLVEETKVLKRSKRK
jgi:hypothetical protein